MVHLFNSVHWLFSGLGNMYQYTLTHHTTFPMWLKFVSYHVLNVTEPLSGLLAKVILSGLLASLSWTLILLKSELFRHGVELMTKNMDTEQVSVLLTSGFECGLCL